MAIRNLLSSAIRLGGMTYRYIAAFHGEDYFVHLGHENQTTEIRGKFGMMFYQGEADGKQYMAVVNEQQKKDNGTRACTQSLYEILPDGKFKYDGGSQTDLSANDGSITLQNSARSPVLLHRTKPEKIQN